MNTVMTEETSRSSESPSTSFSSLPYDVALNILARISLIHRPTLSLASKSFQSLLTSRELHATRALIGKTQNYIYLCLKSPRYNIHKPRWFMLAPTPTQQKLVPMPLFPYEYPESPTVLSIDSEIYIIGGFLNGKRSRRVFLLDCGSRQWRTLPELRIPRGKSASGLIDGKIYVLGGIVGENWGEIYDPKTQSWELLSHTTLTPCIGIQECMDFYISSSFTNFCFVVDEKILCAPLGFMVRRLYWCGFEKNAEWLEVKGLEGLPVSPDFISVANPSGGRRLTVWWNEEEAGKRNIWCAEISFDRRSKKEIYGILEWSKILYSFDYSGYISLLGSATVTH